MREKLIERLEEAYEIRKKTVYINETGGYGDPYKQKLIEHFKLDNKYSNIVKSLSFGTIMQITEDLGIKKEDIMR